MCPLQTCEKETIETIPAAARSPRLSAENGRYLLEQYRKAFPEDQQEPIAAVCQVCDWMAPCIPFPLAGVSSPVCVGCFMRGRDEAELEVRCAMFCERPMEFVQRCDPGGPRCCDECRRKLDAHRSKAVQETLINAA